MSWGRIVDLAEDYFVPTPLLKGGKDAERSEGDGGFEQHVQQGGKQHTEPPLPLLQKEGSVMYLKAAIEDGLKRLLLPSLEREIRSDKKRWADEAAIKVFGENMKNLLLTPPIQ